MKNEIKNQDNYEKNMNGNIKHISNKPISFISFIAFITFIIACEKDITIDLPDVEQKIVIEGHIEQGLPPYIILTKTTPYFSTVGLSTFDSLFVHNAVVTVFDGISEVTLEEFCINDVDTALLPVIIPFMSEFTGISSESLSAINYCIYTVPLADLLSGNYFKGEVEKTYYLTVTTEGKTYTSQTDIPKLVPLDSIWFELQPTFDSLGFIWAHLTDPPEAGNNYRWFAKRQGKDNNFIPPLGSIFDDKFLNGKSFDFFYDKGSYSQHQDGEHDIEDYFYKTGDTIIVKFCTIDRAHYDFWRSFETEIMSNGNPFAAPASIMTNIEGGALGVWGGYGVSYDTTIAK